VRSQPLLRRAAPDRVRQLLFPWTNRILKPALQDDHEEAERRVQQLVRQSEEAVDGEEVAATYNKLAFYGRLGGQGDQAARASETAQTLARDKD
jgi:hypothetical protein